MACSTEPMLRIDVFTIFPDLIDHYARSSILGRAQDLGLLDVTACDLRDGATDARRTVDDTPFGGGAGMVLMPEPIYAAVEARREAGGAPRPLVALVPQGRRFDQQAAERLAGLEGFSLLCGRYEGIDQRVLDDLCDEQISVGDVVLAGGELAALVVIEATARLVPGVLGNDASTTEESFQDGLLEHPQWTKPAVFRDMAVPAILRSGDHAKVATWRRGLALRATMERRPDLIEARGGLSEEDRAALEALARVEGAAGSG
jgi:tRNA (guanine37-N1)-methyltransferase